MSRSIIRFLKYSVVGVSTFSVDLMLLYILTDVLLVNYVIASGLAFVLAVSINYALSRRYVFKGSFRNLKEGYFNFLVIASIGLLIVTGGMYIFVSLLGFNYLISRIGIASVTGFWNYLLNLFVNFKVSGKH